MYNYSRKKKLYTKVKGSLEVNWDFLHTLLLKQSPSDTIHEDKFIKWLRSYIKKNIPTAKIETDHIGNTYVTKGESDIYPCIVAHTDTAQHYHENMQIVNTKTWVLAIDNNTGTQIGPGFDDSVGIYIALTLLKKFDNIKCFFPTMEEIGLIGSSQANFKWFKDCSFLAQPDRNSYNCDFISHTNGIEVCDDSFMFQIKEEMLKYGYSKASGTCTDIGAIKKSDLVECPAFNYSCGYFDEHSDEEVLNCNAFSNALNFLNEVIEKIGYEQHYHKSPKYEPVSYYNSKKWEDPRDYSKLFDDYDDPIVIPDKLEVRHDCEEFSYTDYDSLQWVEECLEYGECPHCQSNNLVEQVDTSILCTDCTSRWNIPSGDVLIKNTREKWEY